MNEYYAVAYPFERNKLYEISPPIRKNGKKHDLVKYYATKFYNGDQVRHAFGLLDEPDWSGQGNVPQSAASIPVGNTLRFGEYLYTISPAKKYYAKKAAEVGTMTGTRAQGPATEEGKSARKAPDVVLPRDITRNIASYLGGKGRRRKTKRGTRLH